eukprot:jgi/Picsp_1/448/NSC_00446-R1_hypothetical protein CHLNCDRAFT_143122 [Chlorella variabilis]
MSNRLELTFRLVLLLGVFACIQKTCMAREISSDLIEEMEGAIMEAKTCHEWGYGNCSEHVGCSACKWRFRWPSIEFCASNTTAAKLPTSLFECMPEPDEMPTDDGSSCSQLSEVACRTSSDCSWCESMAVASACYTKEEAQQLPAAVFSCSIAPF